MKPYGSMFMTRYAKKYCAFLRGRLSAIRPRPARYFKEAQAYAKRVRPAVRQEARQEIATQLTDYNSALVL